MFSPVSAFAGALLTCLLAFFVRVFVYSPISPHPLDLQPLSSSPFPSNDIIQGVKRIGEGVLEGPEDVAMDEKGNIYTATRDGWIKKLHHENGTWEEWRMLGGSALLGLAVSRDGGLLVCDADKGLLKVGEEGVTILASHVQGDKIRFADAVIEASDGRVYFSDASTKFGFRDWFLDLLENKPHGRLLVFDPVTRQTSVLLQHLYFANGVALSADEDFLVVCETWKFRCLKRWLKGESEGKTEVFVDNLPGAPDNVNLAEDGSFWIALLELRLRSPLLDLVHRWNVAKHVVAAFSGPATPSLLLRRKAAVVNVEADGKIRRFLDDSTGKVLAFVTSAKEFEGHLYLGSLMANFLGRLPLNRSHA